MLEGYLHFQFSGGSWNNPDSFRENLWQGASIEHFEVYFYAISFKYNETFRLAVD